MIDKKTKKQITCTIDNDTMECKTDRKTIKYRKITYLTIKPEILASTITSEKIMKWLDEKGLHSRVIEYPSLLKDEERKELEKLIGTKDIYTYKTVWVEEG